MLAISKKRKLLRNIIITLCVLLNLTACTKESDIDYKLVRFCPDGSDCGAPGEIFVYQTNNLILTNPNNSGGGRDDWYKRIK